MYAGPHYRLPGKTRKYRDWKKEGHGLVDMNKAIAQSCDVYFYEAANRLGVDRLAELCFEFGLGQRHDLPMSAIRPGIVPSTKWKAQVYAWSES